MRQYFWIFVFLQANYLVSFKYTWPTLGHSPAFIHTPLSQDGSWSEGFCEEQDSLWSGIFPWLLTHKKSFFTYLVSPLFQKMGDWRSLCPLLKVLPLFILAMTIKELTRDKYWLFTLFLLLLPFWRAKWKWKSLSHVQLFVTPWTTQPMEFSRPEY